MTKLVSLLSYAANTPLLLPPRSPQAQEANARRVVALAFLMIQKHELGVPAYVNGRCDNHAAKVGDAVMSQFWHGFTSASPSIFALRQKLAAACAAQSWDSFMAAEKTLPNVPKAKSAAYVTDEMLDHALDAAAAKLASLPPLPPRQEPPTPGLQGELFAAEKPG